MDKPRIDTKIVYTAVADTLPAEGRDFTLDTAYDDEKKKTKLVVTALTPLGKAWVPFLEARINEKLTQGGVGVKPDSPASDGPAVTVESVRAEVEESSKATLLRRLADADAAAKAAQDNVRRLEEANADPKAVADAHRKTDRDLAEANRLRKVISKVEEVRIAVDAAAREAALADAKAGKDWSFDLKAPLTSLFERQDVRTKLKAKEDLVLAIAEHEVMIAGLRARAAHVAKQYSIQKGDK